MGYLGECKLSINLISFMRQNRHENALVTLALITYQILRLLLRVTQSRLNMVRNEQIDAIHY